MKTTRITTVILLAFLLTCGCGSREEVFPIGEFHVLDESFYELVSKNAVAETIGIDFGFTEGPAWHPEGYLLFSDISGNTIYKWDGRRHPVYRQPSNHSNGLLVKEDGSILVCEHGTRRISLITEGKTDSVMCDTYNGRRLNSPNDLCMTEKGVVFFTDPPWGLEGRNSDPAKELPFNGVYRLKNGELSLVDSTLSWPNGIALSPDDKFLYVANMEIMQDNGEEEYDVFWLRYTLDENARISGKEVFFRMEDTSKPGGPDGMKTDRKGNLFATGPGGILVMDHTGKHLGTIELPLPPSNLAFGPKEKVLYVTARSNIIRIKLN